MQSKIKTKGISLQSVAMLALLVSVVVFVLQQFPPLRNVEKLYADLLLTQFQSDQKPSSDIVIVKITEATLAQFPYRSPLDRKFLAEVIEKILAAEPKAIGVDILIDQATENDKDANLINVISSNSDRVKLAYAQHEDGLSKAQIDYQETSLSEVSKAIVVLARDNNDGVVRHYLDSRRIGDRVFASLSHAMVNKTNEEVTGGYSRIRYQVDPDGKAHRYTEYPAHTVKLLPAAWFTGKYVFIGVDLPLIDRYRTPFATVLGENQGTMPGVVIHAHVLNQLLSGSSIREINSTLGFLMIVIASIFGAAMVSIRSSVWLRVLAYISLVVLVLTSAKLAFNTFSLLTPAISFLVSMTLSAIVISAILWQRDRNEKRFVRDAWTYYVSPVVVDDLITNPSKLELGGEKQDASFIFTDIAGFTSLAEGMPAEQLSPLLNSYLDTVSAQFLEAGATIDKIVGDAVIGFIGAPIADNEHPNKAVNLAMEIDRACKKFRDERQAEGIDFGHTRIGVHSGPAVVGNFGGSNFFDYTALGDTVNTAARLEGANKVFNSHICISGATVERASDHKFRPMARLMLAGKSKLVETFEPLDTIPSGSAPIEEYEIAYKALDTGCKNAHSIFERLAKSYPNDYLVSSHLKRLSEGSNGTVIDLTKGPKL